MLVFNHRRRRRGERGRSIRNYQGRIDSIRQHGAFLVWWCLSNSLSRALGWLLGCRGKVNQFAMPIDDNDAAHKQLPPNIESEKSRSACLRDRRCALHGAPELAGFNPSVWQSSAAVRARLGLPASGAHSCALVGSSGGLLRERYGAEIDAHDLVLRFNDAPTRGFEAVVGRKASLRMLNSQAMADVLSRCATPGSCVPNPGCCPSMPLLLNSGYPRIAACTQSVCGHGLYAPYQAVASLDHGFVAAANTSMSGVLGIALLLSACAGAVDVYGLSAGRDAHAAPYHYYNRCGKASADNLQGTALRLDTLAAIFPAMQLHRMADSHAPWVATPGSGARKAGCAPVSTASRLSMLLSRTAFRRFATTQARPRHRRAPLAQLQGSSSLRTH